MNFLSANFEIYYAHNPSGIMQDWDFHLFLWVDVLFLQSNLPDILNLLLH